mmetsp:Transcript_72837/g.205221  ORF Transcript_72837/g.205221 Transcript_72837/m.205221 type:complete len:236 (+) Transcript_72837:86-793(+)
MQSNISESGISNNRQASLRPLAVEKQRHKPRKPPPPAAKPGDVSGASLVEITTSSPSATAAAPLPDAGEAANTAAVATGGDDGERAPPVLTPPTLAVTAPTADGGAPAGGVADVGFGGSGGDGGRGGATETPERPTTAAPAPGAEEADDAHCGRDAAAGGATVAEEPDGEPGTGARRTDGKLGTCARISASNWPTLCINDASPRIRLTQSSKQRLQVPGSYTVLKAPSGDSSSWP